MESYGTIWVCTCCMLSHANGECCANEQHGGDGNEPLGAIQDGFHVAMGMVAEEHADGCLRRPMECSLCFDAATHAVVSQDQSDATLCVEGYCEAHGRARTVSEYRTALVELPPANIPGDYECDCETNTYSTSQCEGCGSYLHGERHAMTLVKD